MEQRSGTRARAAALASLLLLLAGPAAAQEVYLGFGFGQGRADFDTLGNTLDDDRETTALKFFSGYRLARFLAVEAFYADLRSYSATVQTGTGPISSSVEADGFGAALLLSLPIGERTDLVVKGGGFRWDAVTGFDRESDVGPMYGIGLYLTGPSPSASLRLEYERFKDVGAEVFPGTDDGIDIDLMTLGLIYNF